MAKKKKGKKKKASEDSAKPNKAEIRAYYDEHGWRQTVSHFGIAPKDLSPIVKGKKAGASKKKKAPKKVSKKKAPKKAPKKRGKKKGKKKGGKKGKSVDAPYGLKKDGTPKKAPGRKAGKKKAAKKTAKKTAKKAAKKKRSKKKTTKRKLESRASVTRLFTDDAQNVVLDWMLDYRKKNQAKGHMIPLDSVIIDLTAKLRRV